MAINKLRTLAENVYVDMKNEYEASLARGLSKRANFEANAVNDMGNRRASTIPIPKSYDEAMRSEFAKYWKEAIDVEWANIIEHGVYTWVP